MNKRDKALTICAGLLFVISFFCLSADSYNYDLPDFNKIEISGSFTAVLEKRNSPGLYVETGSSSKDDISWYVSVNTLIIKKKSSFPDFRDIKVIVYYNDEIKSVLAKNSALVKNIRKLKSDKLLIEAASGGIADLIIEADDTEVRSVRTSRITLQGKSEKLSVQADSGSEINSFNLDSQRVRAFAHSGGIIRVSASVSIDGSSGLGSHIYFKGSPSKKIFTSGTEGAVTEIK